jgi:pimeloyl-ACP methyl ester carboxylesterase
VADAQIPPQTRYARSGDLSIAYHVLGKGPPDLVVAPGFISHLEVEYEWPALVEFYDRLSSFCRVIRFDKRGTGLSDRVAGIATPEERMDDVRAVMDAAGSQRATLLGISEGGPVSALFAATYPERTDALILYGSNAGPSRDRSPEEWEALATRIHDRHGTLEEARENLADVAPSLRDDPARVEFLARYFRAAASPGAVVQVLRMNAALDVRNVYPTISVPTLILHRRGDRNVSVEHGRYLAEHIPGATYRELDGDDHLPWVGDSDTIIDEVEELVTGVRDPGGRNRVLATVLFTDIVGSTEQALDVGDRRWRELLEQHHALIRKELDRFRGREIDTAGDGFLASFDGPAQGRPAHRRVRTARRQADGPGGSSWGACRRTRRGGRNLGVEHCQGSRRRLGARLHRPRLPRAEGICG